MQPSQYIVYFNQRIASSFTHQVINKARVVFGEGQWEDHDMDEICPLIKEWRIEHLYLNENELPNILQTIKAVGFPNLTNLYLTGNQIQSIEGTNKIHLPELRWLFLSGNNISSIADIKKAQWKKFSGIHLQINQLNDLSALCFLPPMEGIYVESFSSSEQCCDVRILTKVSLKQESILSINSKKRIKQREAIKKLKMKYNQIYG